MSLILSGTDGLSDVDGSAATPAIRGTDANTGIFFPAADTIAFAEGGAEVARFDSSGNFGLGVTPSAFGGGYKAFEVNAGSISATTGAGNLIVSNNSYFNGTNFIYKATGVASDHVQTGGQHWFRTAASGTAGNAISFTQAMTLDASGNLGIGTTSPPTGYRAQFVDTRAADSVAIGVRNLSSSGITRYVLGNDIGFARMTMGYTGSTFVNPSIGWIGTEGGEPFYFQTNGTERARITSGGNFGIGNTNPSAKLSVAGTVLFEDASGNGFVFNGCQGDSFGGGAAGTRFVADPVSGGNWQFWRCVADYNGTPSTMAYLYSNGGLANYSGNNSNLSDIRVKKDIELAGSYLNKICAIPVKTFKYKNQTLDEDQELTLGVIAQDVEAVAPELVNTSGFGETPDDGIPLKAIYQTDLQYALMKCIQEQQALITQLTARITALESA